MNPSTKRQRIIMDLSKLTDQELSLLVYTTCTYKPGTFNTSLTTCSMFETKAEKLIGACFDEETDWIESLLPLVIGIVQKADLELDGRESMRLQRFAVDAISDLLFCHLREM